MAELKSLIRKRAAVKARLTSFSNYLQQFAITQDDDTGAVSSIPEKDIIQVECRTYTAEQLLLEFGTIQTQIEALTDDDTLEEQFQHTADFENAYFTAISLAKAIIATRNEIHANDDNLSVASGSRHSATNAQANSNVLTGIKLPTIQLPKFDGNYETWLEYRDTYESLIHFNEGISSIQKYHYLRASLESSSASQVIKSLEFTGENYDIAWNTLCERYNNTRLLISNHVKALFNIEPVVKESANKLRKLIDEISKHLRALEQLEQPVEKWDTLIIHLVTTKLDIGTARRWEEYKADKDIPTLQDLKTFLKSRADLLETLEQRNAPKGNIKHSGGGSATTRGLFSGQIKCVLCSKDHLIYNCEDFLKLSTDERIAKVQNLRLCSNCLKLGHLAKNCRLSACRKCKAKHNTLLHIQGARNVSESEQQNVDKVTSQPDDKVTALSSYYTSEQVLLSTALVQVFDRAKTAHTVRVLLDSASMSSFISSQLCDKLKLAKSEVNVTVLGLNNSCAQTTQKCDIQIQSLYNDFSASISCFTLPKITDNLPDTKVNVGQLQIPPNIRLADPGFYKPGNIDLLIGADLFWSLICVGQLARFWEIEECSFKQPFSSEENAVEEHFIKTTTRNSEGRFIVALPFKEPVTNLGESRDIAKKRFYALERKLQANPNLRQTYTEFLDEYQQMGHMTKIKEPIDNGATAYYMPHHGVLKESSVTTKLRVVFDASSPTSNGVSLNAIQMVGPTLQDDLLSIILRFRTHTYVFSADVAKMYRMVLVKNEQRLLQLILWRNSPEEPLDTYSLNTVTYGQAASSYLAIRCLMQLAYECETELPDISQVIQHDFYVDDLLSGANSIEEAVYIAKGVSDVLRSGCFELRQWASNEPTVISSFNEANCDTKVFEFGVEKETKTLGLKWSCKADNLMYNIDRNLGNSKVTKRSILSQISRIFDPLGLLSPCTIIAKSLLQKLWSTKLTWDESLPSEAHTIWTKFSAELSCLNDLKVPRHVICRSAKYLELHIFSDASTMAYGSCVYVRSVNQDGEISVRLLCAKSKVAPIKVLTTPRLELQGALISARLADKVIKSLRVNFNKCLFWTDSTIVLGWIRTSPHLLKTFVSNRVVEIQNLTNPYEWRYVPTGDNPADLLSRGLYPTKIKSCSLWWNGPPYLKENCENWPILFEGCESLPETKQSVQTYFNEIDNSFPFERFSDLTKLKRTTAYIVRFKNNALKDKRERKFGPLLFDEITHAFYNLIRVMQRVSFPDDYNRLSHGNCVNIKSRLLSLNPFMDENHIIRVGGRLRNSDYNFEKKHPMLLAPNHKLTKLIFEDMHKRLLHPGPQLLLSNIREEFWPILGRNLAKSTFRRCITCFKNDPKTITPIMGNFPGPRLNISFPFQVVGVDYAGPLLMKDRKGRGAKTSKCYICLFVCFATKAVHIELVTDLTTDNFILALRRFASRRGKPSDIYSDNGKNFVGANRELENLGKFLITNSDQLTSACISEKIRWHFIPAHAPHMGGLWEAGIKCAKQHLKRVAGNLLFTYEELYSLLVQIEGIMNSRPLSPISTDPDDFTPLTPAHLLIGKSITSIPEVDLDLPSSRLSMYQHIQQIKQHFWKRWSKEYISEMQQRHRWKQGSNDLRLNTLVLIKDDNLPPLRWRLGRIIQLHPGKDGINRVATVKTAEGQVKRAFTKLCPLPMEEAEAEQHTTKTFCAC